MRNDCMMSVLTFIVQEKVNVKTINNKKIEKSIIVAKQEFVHSTFIMK